MRPTPFPEFYRGGRFSAAEENRLRTLVESRSDLRASQGMSAHADSSGVQFFNDSVHIGGFWAQLTAYDSTNDKYAWVQVLENGDGTFSPIRMEGAQGQERDADGNLFLPAYEANAKIVAISTVVRMYWGNGPWMYFFAPAGAGSTGTIQRHTLSSSGPITLTDATVDWLQITVSAPNVSLTGLIGGTPDRPLVVTVEPGLYELGFTGFTVPFTTTPTFTLQPSQSAFVRYDDAIPGWVVIEERLATAVAKTTSTIPVGSPGSGPAHLYTMVSGALTDTGDAITLYSLSPTAILPGVFVTATRDPRSGLWFTMGPGGTNVVNITNIYSTSVVNNSYVYNSYNDTLYWYYNGVYYIISAPFVSNVCFTTGQAMAYPGGGTMTVLTGVSVEYTTPLGRTYCVPLPTGCCPTCPRCASYTLPNTLTLTLQSDGSHSFVGPPPGCDCLDGSSVTLTYDATNKWWYGTATVGGCSADVLKFYFYCIKGGWQLLWVDSTTGQQWATAAVEIRCCQFLWEGALVPYPYCNGPVYTTVTATGMSCGSGSGSGSGGDTLGCSECPAGAALQFTFDAGAVLNNTATNCGVTGGRQTVTYVNTCHWIGSTYDIGGFVAIWDLSVAGGVVTLELEGPGAIYTASSVGWNCMSPLTLTLNSVGLECHATAASITIVPL